MSSKGVSLADLIRTVAEEESERLGPPPSSDDLAGYVVGELTDEQTERIRDHLALRRDGRDEVLALRSLRLKEPPGEKYRVSDEEIDDAWRRLANDSGFPESAAESKPAAAWGAALKRYFMFPVTVPALATALAVGFLGASLWHREAPRLNVEVVDLLPKSHVQRSIEPHEDAVKAGAKPYVLNLNPGDVSGYSAYEVAVLDADGKIVWTERTRQRTAIGNLNVYVPSGYLAPGAYEVRLFGIREGGRELLEEFPVRIAP